VIDGAVAALDRMNVAQLARRYRELFGNDPECRNRQLLIRQFAWKLQSSCLLWKSGIAGVATP
jgi:hypothetical protein